MFHIQPHLQGPFESSGCEQVPAGSVHSSRSSVASWGRGVLGTRGDALQLSGCVWGHSLATLFTFAWMGLL